MKYPLWISICIANVVYCVALSSRYSFLLSNLTITLGKKPVCLPQKAAYIYIFFFFPAKALKNGIEVLNTFEEY